MRFVADNRSPVMSRFVVLHHFGCPGRSDHFDLMLESAGQLQTWSLAEWPGTDVVTAKSLPAHRLHYLQYEGPVSGGRGQVRRVDEGQYWLAAGSFTDKATAIEFDIDGRQCSGWCRLEWCGVNDHWTWEFRPGATVAQAES